MNEVEDRDIPPPLPPKLNRTLNSKTLRDAEWYWGDVSRETVNERFRDQPDGTFIVRDSSRGGSREYTLTVRKGGTNKLIRILHKNGMYGFAEPLTFTSVINLVTFYRNRTLAQYNAKLDVNLTNPLPKYEEEEEEQTQLETSALLDELKAAQNSFQKMSVKYDELHHELIETEEEINELENSLQAQKEVVSIIEDQIKIHISFQIEAPPHQRATLQQNNELLQTRMAVAQNELRDLENMLTQANSENRYTEIENEMNKMRPHILHLERVVQQYITTLTARTELTLEDIQAEIGSHILSKENWFCGNMSREEAEAVLYCTPSGTFLIRERTTNVGSYALALMYQDQVWHIRINNSSRGFGLVEADDSDVYVTLTQLVHYYNKQSLEVHNQFLHTTLMLPLRVIKDRDESDA